MRNIYAFVALSFLCPQVSFAANSSVAQAVIDRALTPEMQTLSIEAELNARADEQHFEITKNEIYYVIKPELQKLGDHRFTENDLTVTGAVHVRGIDGVERVCPVEMADEWSRGTLFTANYVMPSHFRKISVLCK